MLDSLLLFGVFIFFLSSRYFGNGLFSCGKVLTLVLVSFTRGTGGIFDSSDSEFFSEENPETIWDQSAFIFNYVFTTKIVKHEITT